MSDSPTIIGVEVEYALAPRNTRDLDASPDRRAGRGSGRASLPLECRHEDRASNLIARVRARYPFLHAERGGVFLGNGARLYNDRGHVEYSTPETSCPREATAHVLAGRWLLFEVLGLDGFLDHRGEQLALYDINLDYAEPHCAFWASHENYAFKGCAASIRRAVTPHLCSRVIFTGGGGFDPFRPLAFVLSPRAHMTPPLAYGSIPDELTFFHARQQPYASRGFDRLHIVCSESLRSHRATYLKLGTTALIVWLAQRGHEIERAFRPLHPRQAIGAFSSDPSGDARVPCHGGGTKTALEIQWAVLAMAQRVALVKDFPAWAGEVIELWRDSLGQFATGGQPAMQPSFDWAMKWGVFDSYCRHAGMPFERLLRWDAVLAKLFRVARESRPALASISDLHPVTVTRRMILKCEEQLAAEANSFVVDWDELSLVLDLRLKLRELDWRFCQIGEGIFDQLNCDGWLDHQAPDLTADTIQSAMTTPPQDTRAKVRSHWINAFHMTKNAERARVDWEQIKDPSGNRVLELPDPTAIDGRWSNERPARNEPADFLMLAIRCYETSRFMDAGNYLRRARSKIRWDTVNVTSVGTHAFRVLRYSAWIAARTGQFEAINHLHQIYGPGLADAQNSLRLADHLYCCRFLGLEPYLNMEKLIPSAFEFLRSPPDTDEPHNANVREHVAAYLLATGRLDEAMEMIRPCTREPALWRRVRCKCLMGDIARRLGRMPLARELVDACRSMVADDNPLLAEQVLPMRAELEPNQRERVETLIQATDFLRDVRHPMALARVLLMRVRGCRDVALARFIRREFGCVRLKTPALRLCPLAKNICRNWTAWTMRFEPDESGDVWWGL